MTGVAVMTGIVVVSIAVVVWLMCAVAAAGFFYAHFNPARTCNRSELGTALLFGLWGGPVALITAFFLSGFGESGWRLR